MGKFKETVLNIYKKYYSGKGNAIARERFLMRHFPLLDDRKFRQIYSELPIVTCDKGGFYPIRKEEILEYRGYLRKKAIPLFERFRRVCNAHPDLAGDEEQMELFGCGIL